MLNFAVLTATLAFSSSFFNYDFGELAFLSSFLAGDISLFGGVGAGFTTFLEGAGFSSSFFGVSGLFSGTTGFFTGWILSIGCFSGTTGLADLGASCFFGFSLAFSSFFGSTFAGSTFLSSYFFAGTFT